MTVEVPAGTRRRTRRRLTPYLFLAPTLFFVTILFLGPFTYNVVISFFDWSLLRPKTFVGLENFVDVLTSDRFWDVLGNTVVFVLLTVPVGFVLSLAVAVGLHALQIKRGSALIRTLYFVPVIASLTAVAATWQWIFNPTYGLANALLDLVGLPGAAWLTSTEQVLPSLAVMYIWARLGFNAIILFAGLNAIDRSYFEAARLDGASGWQSFRFITIPLLNRQIVLVISVELMNALKIFDLPFAATHGGPNGASRTLIMEVHEQAFKFDAWGVAAVYVLMTFLLILLVTLVVRKVLSRDISES